MDKRIPLWLLALVVIIGVVISILYGWTVRYATLGKSELGRVGSAAIRVSEFPSLVNSVLYEIGVIRDSEGNRRLPPLLVKNRFLNVDGFSRDGVVQAEAKSDDGYLLLSAYDDARGQSVVKLVSISEQKVLHEWVPDLDELKQSFNPGPHITAVNDITPAIFRMGHPLLMSDGGLIFHNFEGPLVNIDVCSGLRWINNDHFHHSIEMDADGNLWVPSVIEPSSYDRLKFAGYRDDAIAKVNSAGDVLFKKSVSEILEENGYRGLVFGVGPYVRDLIHLNDIQPALTSTKFWEKGDLLLSLRHRSTVFLYRPSTNKVVWLRTGPWLNQHDPNFIGSSRISVFGNDVITTEGAATNIAIDGVNNVYVYDFENDLLSTPYTDVLRKLDVRTLTEGRHNILDNGDVYIEESNYGRLLRVSREDAVWEYVNSAGAATAGLVSWSRYLSRDEILDVIPKLKLAACS